MVILKKFSEAQPPVNVAGNARSSGADGDASAGEHHDNHQFAGPAFIERSKPSKVGAAFAAGACFAQNFVFLFGAARRAELDRAAHARLDLLDVVADIQMALHLRLEVLTSSCERGYCIQ